MARIGAYDPDIGLFDPTLDILGWFDPDLITDLPDVNTETPPKPAPEHEWIRGTPNVPVRGTPNTPVRGLGWRQIR